MKQWKPIKGYESLYKISDEGDVVRLSYVQKMPKGGIAVIKEHTIKPILGRDGYWYICLTKDSKHKRFSLHRLVATMFVENPNNYSEVNHKDENRKNPCANNLEWCDRKYNANYGTAIERARAKMSQKIERYTLDGQYIDTWISEHEFTKAHGYNGESLIKKVCSHKPRYKTAYGYRWKYVGDNTPFRPLNEKMREVSQYDINGKYMATYKSIIEASEKTGISRHTISNTLNGRKPKSHVYIWKYKEE